MTPNYKYFKVIAKCGHVGKGNYVPVAFAVRAENRSDASQKAMTFPRVKKHLKDVIISCEEIDRDSYKELIQANREFKYLQCTCKRQQLEIEDFSLLIHRNIYQQFKHKVEPAKSIKYKRAIYEMGGRRCSVSLCYGEE